MVFFLWLSLLGLHSFLLAEPLSEAKIKSAKKIVLLKGDFDPWTIQDEQLANRLLGAEEKTLVVVLPIMSRGLDFPLPVSHRTRLVDASMNSHQSIVYPTNELSELAKDPREFESYLKKLNAKAEFLTEKAPASSFNIRSFLTKHSELYFSLATITPPEIHPAVLKTILKDGLYIGREPETGSVILKNISRDVARATEEFDR